MAHARSKSKLSIMKMMYHVSVPRPSLLMKRNESLLSIILARGKESSTMEVTRGITPWALVKRELNVKLLEVRDPRLKGTLDRNLSMLLGSDLERLSLVRSIAEDAKKEDDSLSRSSWL